MIKIEQEAETALFKLTVSNVNLTMAYDLAMEAERIIPAELTDTLQGKAKIVSADTPKPDTKRKPVIPVKTILVLNLIAVATSYALLLIFELLSSTISEPDDLKPNFSLPVLGQIAHWKNLKDKATSKGQDNNSKNQVLLNDETPFIIVEGFNNIRTNLLHLSSDYKCPVYATASQQSEAGKSIIISNIALSFANIGKKVLLIDADMRFPRQSMIFGTQAEKGLSNFLANYSKSDVNFNDYISKTNYANLDLITSGEIPKNPSDLLSSNATAKLIEYAKDIYDVIFIDLPPIGPVSDAVIISSLVNGYFLVVRAGETNTKSIEQSLEILEFSKAKVSGFILNNMNTKSLKDCCQYSYE